MGFALIRLGKYEEALDYLNKCITLNQNNYNTWYNKGLVYKELGMFDKALECFDNSLKINRSNYYALYERGTISARLGDYESALSYIDKALKLNPKDKYALYEKCYILAKLGRYEECKKYYYKLLKDNPNYTLKYTIDVIELLGNESNNDISIINDKKYLKVNSWNKLKLLLIKSDPSIYIYSIKLLGHVDVKTPQNIGYDNEVEIEILPKNYGVFPIKVIIEYNKNGELFEEELIMWIHNSN